MALDTLTDPNKNRKNLQFLYKGLSTTGKTQVIWLTEITRQGHATAGHSATDSLLHCYLSLNCTATSQTCKTCHLFWTYTSDRVRMRWNSPCLCKEIQNRIVLLVYTRISQECGTEKWEVIKMSYILALSSLFRHIMNSIGNTEDKFRHMVEQRGGTKVLVSNKEQ